MKEELENLKEAVWDYDPEGVARLTMAALRENKDPGVIMDALTQAIRKVGEGYEKRELFLPELIGAADALQRAVPILEEAFRDRGGQRKSTGIVVIGTVSGDIHTIGKTMVGSLLTAEGFEVHDLGIDVPVDEFVEAVGGWEPDILAMSALLTTTAPEVKKVIDALQEVGLRERVRVMAGGGAMTEHLARSMGADGYDPTAPGAVKLAMSLLGISA
jgi:methanogenic corrinoid protein MtbC1